MDERFRELASRHGANDIVIARWWQLLERHYAEPHRRYHTMQHIRDILPLVNGDAAQLAVLFHDAIYDTQSHDNEAKSAELAARALADLAFDPSLIARVEAMIVATAKHDPAGLDEDGLRFLDADLSILGSDAARYDDYALATRDEYAWVPQPILREKRAEILEHFLQRPRIYFTESLRERFEAAARVNGARELVALRARNDD